MGNIATLLTNRATAGAAYAAAAQAYVDAFVELAAQEGALGNKNITGGVAAYNFGTLPEVLPHGEFLSRAAMLAMTSPNVVVPAINTRTAAIIASYVP